MISGKNVSTFYKHKKGKKQVLNNVCFELKQNRITAFIGKSGAGKTTLLKCMAHLQESYEGLITYNGQDLKSASSWTRASTVGFVHQQFHLFPHFTALQNCTYALEKVLGLKEEALKRATQTLQLLEMSPFLHAYPAQLSGGQQQRVAIARALVMQPKILLLDEPTSALDPESKKSLETALLSLQNQGLTIALSSHDMPFIRKCMDCIYYLEEGRVVEQWDSQSKESAAKEKINKFLFEEL